MSNIGKIDKIYQKIQNLYVKCKEPSEKVPLALQAYQLAHVAEEYIGAASLLEKEKPQYWLPVLQLTGHAVECSLKACLATANSEPPNEHGLVELCKLVAKQGFLLDDPHITAIVLLHHFYFKDLATGTKFKTRYPAKDFEGVGGAVPTNSTFLSIIRCLIKQAAQKSVYREMFDTMRILQDA